MLSSGTKLGPYEILSPLGKGGMGEVYRAKDTRLDRDVAIKVLPGHLTANAEFKQRFEREAKAISSLTHPNICTLHDIGHEGGVDYLVMELIEGETLSQRISRGPLPLEELLCVGGEIASALDKAHRAGVVHRDLKPGNIMLTKSGAKLLDFGLAKNAPGQSALSTAPDAVTITEPLTSKGTIVGTFQYMAPEQLEGKEADQQTDIFAFGAVLYEMATGKRAFEGSSRASLIASIMSSQPRAISELQPMTPPALEHLVRSCLAKSPDDRIQSAHDVKLQLQWIAQGGSQFGVPAPVVAKRAGRQRIISGIAVVATVATLSLLALYISGSREVMARALSASLLPPEGVVFVYDQGPPAISPDGSKIVSVCRTADDDGQLWLRDLEGFASRELKGTDGATFPFWSPDSRSIGFFAEGKLKTVEARGGPPDTLCDAPEGHGGSWNEAGLILFTPTDNGTLSVVAASGGTPVAATELDPATRETEHSMPSFLPDGQHFLFSTWGGTDGTTAVSIGALDGSPPKVLLEIEGNAIYAEPGYLLYWRNGSLRAQSFDAVTLALTGEPVIAAPHTRLQPSSGAALFSVSRNGILAYHQGQGAAERSRLVLRNRKGEQIGTAGPPGNFYAPQLSHDGLRVAVDNSGIQNNGDIWIYSLTTPSATRLTSDIANETRPVWSPDDHRLVYHSVRNLGAIFERRVGGPQREEKSLVVVEEGRVFPQDWSPDGKYILLGVENIVGARETKDIWLYAVEDDQPSPLIESPYHDDSGQFSPDGRWLAYSSNESGRTEVYLQSFPELTRRRQVSLGGGICPRWSYESYELFYLAPDGTIMAVALDRESGELTTPAVPLFKAKPRFSEGGQDYDVTPDGQTFLINEAIQDDASASLSLLINWTAKLDTNQ